MGIPPGALPDNSVWLTYAYDAAYATVNTQLSTVPGPFYMLAVYNLGGDNLVNWAQDDVQPPYPFPTNNPTGLLYFAYLRDQFKINAFVPGVINSSSDEGTSQSMDTLDAYKNFTLSNLQNLKTPWGRTYLGFAQRVGTLWGLTP